MDLRQLEYFVAVAEERNFTRAAERVHISQSGVSAQIRQLERELGAELFDRSARTATLTAAGAAALGHARAALAAAEAVGQAVGEVSELIRGRVTVGMVVGCTVTPFFDALAAFHGAHPGVAVSLLEGRSDRLVEEVRSGAVDVALVGTAGEPPAGLDSRVLVSEPLVAVVAPGHPLAGRKRLRLRDLTGRQLISMPEGSGLRSVFDRCCAAAGVQPAVALEASAADAIADLSARGLGVGLLSESMAPRYRDRLTALPITDATVPGLLVLVWRPAPPPAVRALVARLPAGAEGNRSRAAAADGQTRRP
ncbi:LysR family transcriptional regulator [Phaeacidiphilus oryzae]|uniref:LysR family transcriptional regulator n=1 Tax=Phaeacidiphilus oryzae TaxID=348818 RepID=UPI0009FC4BB0|nr:LysR family transcriptional regulator [Phaeacidiphilus oryzae]